MCDFLLIQIHDSKKVVLFHLARCLCPADIQLFLILCLQRLASHVCVLVHVKLHPLPHPLEQPPNLPSWTARIASPFLNKMAEMQHNISIIQ